MPYHSAAPQDTSAALFTKVSNANFSYWILYFPALFFTNCSLLQQSIVHVLSCPPASGIASSPCNSLPMQECVVDVQSSGIMCVHFCHGVCLMNGK